MKKHLLGPEALVQTLSISRTFANPDIRWQYHPRSDHHSKVACTLMLIDLLISCEPLRNDVIAGKVACGINHTMVDFKSDRKKNLDLVIHMKPKMKVTKKLQTLKDLVRDYGIKFTASQQLEFDSLPEIPIQPVGKAPVLIAFEAKACMTEFGKARPRLFDELHSAMTCIHGDTQNAIAVGFVMINGAEMFISPTRFSEGLQEGDEPKLHNQPKDFESVVEKIQKLERRSNVAASGYDAIAMVGIYCKNDHSKVKLFGEKIIPDPYSYGQMIERVRSLYQSRVRV